MIKKFVLSNVVMAILLFLWGGLCQVFPWGVSSTQNISCLDSTASQSSPVSNMQYVAPLSLSTDDFDAQFMGKISTYTTEKSFSWIITQAVPINYGAYFGKEILNQFFVALLLTTLLILSHTLPLKRRMFLIFTASLVTCAATYGQLINWWQMPLAYGLGASFNLILGWVLTGFISARFILPSIPIISNPRSLR